MLELNRLFTPALVLCAFLAFQDWMGANPLGMDALGLRAATPCAEWAGAGDTQRRHFLRSHGLRLPGHEPLARARCEMYPGEPLGAMAEALKRVSAASVSRIAPDR